MDLAKKVLADGIVVLELTGDMRMGTDCQRLTKTVDKLIEEKERRIILDLSPLKLIDSASVGAIVSCFSLFRRSGGTMRVAGVKGMVETVLKVTQIHRAIGFFPTVAAAAENFPPAGPPPVSAS